MILVDTSVWISFLNGVNSAEAAYLAVCIAEDRPLIIPGLVRTEVLLGARTESNALRISQSLQLRRSRGARRIRRRLNLD